MSNTNKAYQQYGILANVYAAKGFGDCSNQGISSRCRSVVVVDARLDEIFAPTDDAPAVRLVERELGDGRTYVHAVPVGSEGHHMFGGCFIYTSDSRLRALCDYPIPLHDRREP